MGRKRKSDEKVIGVVVRHTPGPDGPERLRRAFDLVFRALPAHRARGSGPDGDDSQVIDEGGRE